MRQDGVHIVAVHVGDEVHLQARVAVGAQGQYGHFRTQVGAANADIHHIGDRLARVAQPAAIAHLVGEGLDAVQHCMHVGIHVLAVDLLRLAARHTQGGVQYATAFGNIDFFTGKHGIALFHHAARAGQVHQQPDGLVVGAVLGVIQEQACRIDRHAREAAGVFLEQLAHLPVAGVVGVDFKGLVGRGGSQGGQAHNVRWHMVL